MGKRQRQRRRSSSSSNKKTKTTATSTGDTPETKSLGLCFQDIWDEYCSNQASVGHNGYESGDDADVSNVFFELANAPSVCYRLQKEPRAPAPNSGSITIQQDVSGAAETHTGGIVWETSYLLLNYLLASKEWLGTSTPLAGSVSKKTKSRTILEIGAGCGMLGLSLHKAFELGIIGGDERIELSSSRVILTETNEVMENLQRNLEQNYPCLSPNNGDDCESNKKAVHHVSVDELDWTRYEHDCSKAGIDAHSIDCIVGTDVVFSTRFVLPMLETMQFLSHSQTVIFLCLQERCKDSHQLLLKEAIRYGFLVDDISATVYTDKELAPTCSFGRALECKLLKFTVVAQKDITLNEKAKTKKEKKKRTGDKTSKKKL